MKTLCGKVLCHILIGPPETPYCLHQSLAHREVDEEYLFNQQCGDISNGNMVTETTHFYFHVFFDSSPPRQLIPTLNTQLLAKLQQTTCFQHTCCPPRGTSILGSPTLPSSPRTYLEPRSDLQLNKRNPSTPARHTFPARHMALPGRRQLA